jgi:iron complex outermembrane receptor protein
MRTPQHFRLSLCTLIIFLSSFSAFAQSGTIKGIVRDERGPLAGASVSVEGKGKGTTTNDNGEYQLQVAPGKYTIAITYAGYRLNSKRIEVKPNEILSHDAILESGTLGEDIVVVGSRAAGRTKLTTPVPVDLIPISQVINDI